MTTMPPCYVCRHHQATIIVRMQTVRLLKIGARRLPTAESRTDAALRPGSHLLRRSRPIGPGPGPAVHPPPPPPRFAPTIAPDGPSPHDWRRERHGPAWRAAWPCDGPPAPRRGPLAALRARTAAGPPRTEVQAV